MKGPSIHQGTAAHKSALKIKSVEARKAEIGAAGASAECGSKSSPVKKDWATAIKNDPKAIAFASPELQNNEEIVIEALT